ncbi:Aluminum-activated malate transporter 10 [Ananas comosus]|uniref:Aluminum-activated malate transporter 10 n=1 Tax=Ananas comosus TaxID=4615 RepID=A0A199UIS9_ANACO|nr:Aluminum-activated malate transporter 10 [Ananas comosus]
MAAAESKEVQGGLEWRVKVPEGSTAKMESEAAAFERAAAWLVGCMVMVRMKVVGTATRVWRIGADDPRKVMHGLKVGLALTLVSLFYYTRPLYDGVGRAAMWAIMTVVVVFEYTVGGCLYKGFNRATATLSAGALAIGVHWIAAKSGHKVEPVILGASVFLLASTATFSRFIPTVKARFDYGVTIFILTYSLVAVSGYRVEQLLTLAQQRLSTIAIGICICLLVCVLICPVWAGQELHLLIVRNMEKLADSLEGSVEDYFTEDRIADPKSTSPSQKSQGYKCVLNSKASEDSQANLARWEPAHGRFGFRHPWSQYQKVGAAMRYCAYCIEALSGCINSEIQAPESIKKHLSDVCMRLSSQCSMVLKDMSSSIKAMRRSQGIDVLVADMNEAVQDLQSALKALPSQLIQGTASPQREAASDEKHSISVTATLPLMEALPLITVASLLIEISSRIEGAVNAVETLARLAKFDDPTDDEKSEKMNNISNSEKVLQEV